jgi:CRP-like cAMP-binding protein
MSPHALPLRCQSCTLVSPGAALACPFENRLAEAGTEVLKDGQGTRDIVFLRRGRVAISSRTAKGDPVPYAVRGAGSLLGLEGVLGAGVPYSVSALTDVALCAVGAPAFHDWIGSLASPLGAAFLHAVREASRRSSERQGVEGTALGRVARFLVQSSEAGGTDESDEIPLGVLAQVLRMRAETLSRALSRLRAMGALAPGRGTRISNLKRLREAAG